MNETLFIAYKDLLVLASEFIEQEFEPLQKIIVAKNNIPLLSGIERAAELHTNTKQPIEVKENKKQVFPAGAEKKLDLRSNSLSNLEIPTASLHKAKTSAIARQQAVQFQTAEKKPFEIQLEIPEKKSPSSFSDVERVLSKLPHRLSIRKEIPDDSIARSKNYRKILAGEYAFLAIYDENWETSWKVFLRNVTQAIDLYIQPAAMLSLQQLLKNQSFLGKVTQKGLIQYFLVERDSILPKIPSLRKESVHILHNLQEYFHRSELKKELWELLVNSTTRIG